MTEEDADKIGRIAYRLGGEPICKGVWFLWYGNEYWFVLEAEQYSNGLTQLITQTRTLLKADDLCSVGWATPDELRGSKYWHKLKLV